MDPWSKEDYSRHIWEALMVVEKLPEINPPSGRLPGQVCLAILILESRRQRNSDENHVTEGLLRFSEQDLNIGLRRATWEVPPQQAGPWRGLPPGPCQVAAWDRGTPLRLPFVLLESSS